MLSIFVHFLKISLNSCYNFNNEYYTGRKKCNFLLVLILFFIISISQDFNLSGNNVGEMKKFSFVSASYYHPNWQQYYPQRRWPHYDEQIHGRPRRLRVGQGRYRMLPSGAQLMCDFPDTMMFMISNIIWERADLGHGNSLDDIYRDHGIQQDYVLLQRPRGSTLHLFEVTPLDRGLYRCIASALDPASGNSVTLFQDIHFYPIF